MFIIKCPYCGERDYSEFNYGGEAHIVRPKQPTELSDVQWAEYLFIRKNIKAFNMKDGTMLMDVDVGLIWLEIHQMIKFTLFIKWEKNQLDNVK